LRRDRTDSIGLVISDTGHPVLAEMIRGLDEEARSRGLILLLANSEGELSREAESVSALVDRRVDGLILVHVGRDEGLPPRLGGQPPTVLLDRLANVPLDQVGVETRPAMARAVSHLIETGHRRISMVIGDLTIPTNAERAAGYKDALTAAGIQPPDPVIERPCATAAEAKAVAAEILTSRARPTAMVGMNDQTTIGTLAAIAGLGRRIPEDVAMVTFDDLPWADLFSPRLTAVAQPAFEMGRTAMQLMVRRLAEPDAEVRVIRLTPKIIHRTSCGCAPNEAVDWGPFS
jgi:LacI family transcriptional regulator